MNRVDDWNKLPSHAIGINLENSASEKEKVNNFKNKLDKFQYSINSAKNQKSTTAGLR